MTTINTIKDQLEVLEDCNYIFNEIQVTNDPILRVTIQEGRLDISNNKISTVNKTIYLNKQHIINFYD